MEVLPGQSVQIFPSVAPQLLFPSGGPPGPCLVRLPASQELLAAKDNYTFFVQQDGKVRGAGGVTLGRAVGGRKGFHVLLCADHPQTDTVLLEDRGMQTQVPTVAGR
jgi:hypothetical protein